MYKSEIRSQEILRHELYGILRIKNKIRGILYDSCLIYVITQATPYSDVAFFLCTILFLYENVLCLYYYRRMFLHIFITLPPDLKNSIR
ncbi:conserved domain protein [Bacteroides clarus YIT 12056]|uniref:Conserved domain protein n=1 Tax=Bacteroides clarus YIT 12056 TaxID=762984 RepID=A0ABP2KTU5_9BACE|nr:conserved domain protein [Bacteroides clarus YIT 12056]